MRRNMAFIGALDHVFEGVTQIAAAFGEKSGGMGVIVDGGAVGKHEAAMDAGRAAPVNEHFFDGFPFRMVADDAFALVMRKMRSARGAFGVGRPRRWLRGNSGCHGESP